MLLLRQVRQQCVGALRASSSTEKAVRNEPKPATRAQVEAACVPEVFKSTDSLVRHLEQSMIHVPGRFVIVQKPFGISCTNTRSDYSWQRHSSQSSPSQEDTDRNRYEATERPIVLVDCIPRLSELLHEPQLGFWTGMRRYVSGPLILPCGRPDFDMLWKSVHTARRMEEADADFHPFSALTLVVGEPKQPEGTVYGYVAFEQINGQRKFFFTEGPYTSHLRNRGKLTVQGGIAWSTIASGHDCSLLHLKFSQPPIPRFALAHVGCPMLGDHSAMERLFDVDGEPVHVNMLQAAPENGKMFIPHQLIARLGPDARLPDFVHFHIMQQLFPKYGGSSDLAISAALSPHFEAMIDLLGFGEALKKFWNEKESVDSEVRGAALVAKLRQEHPPQAISPSLQQSNPAKDEQPKLVASSQFKAAYMPEVFKSTDSLVRHLEQSMIRHELGRYVILQKPNGVSCHTMRGAYTPQRSSESSEKEATANRYESFERPLTIVDCIPQLSKLLNEPQLGYWAGLARTFSGPIVLPCNKRDYEMLHATKDFASTLIEKGEGFHKFSSLALTIGRPKRDKGSIKGNVVFERLEDRRESYFMESTGRWRNPQTGRYTSHDCITWNTIASGHDCSLLHVQCQRPQIIVSVLSHLCCPVLGSPLAVRLFKVNGNVVSLKPSQAAEYKGEKYIPHQLIARLGPDAPPLSDLPLYIHVLQQVFPNYDGSSDLVASAPVPPHFEAMVDLLGFGEALKKFRNEDTPISPDLILQGLDHESSAGSNDDDD